MSFSKTLSLSVIAGMAVLAALAPDPLILLFTATVLAMGLVLLWPGAAAPLLLLPFGFQWVQTSTKPIFSAMTDTPMGELAERGADIVAGAYFGLAGVLALAIGLRLGAGRRSLRLTTRLRESLRQLDAMTVLRLSLGAIVVGNILEALTGSAGSARQILLGFSGLKLAGVFLLTYSSMVTGRHYLLTIGVVGLDLLSGMLGFFSNFRETLFVAAIAVVAGSPKLSARSVVAIAAAGVITALMAVFWSAVKPDFRQWLNQGSGLQQVNQPLLDRLSYILDAAAGFSGEQFEYGASALINRISYIDFLSHTLEYVPHSEPHAAGSQTIGAVQHIATPRILFPWKAPLPSDTAVTAQYTGLIFLGGAGTSISIGYLGELYVDFGIAGALAAALALGFLVGRGFGAIVGHSKTPIALNVALAVVPLMPVMLFETALVKVVGGGLMAFLTIFAFQRFVLPRLLATFASRKKRRSAGLRRAPAYRA